VWRLFNIFIRIVVFFVPMGRNGFRVCGDKTDEPAEQRHERADEPAEQRHERADEPAEQRHASSAE
jgi:hypothetical protein